MKADEVKVKVLFHLNEGYTKVLLEETLGVGLADGGIYWDIPTKIIPVHLRTIGSRFLLLTDYKDIESLAVKEFETEL